MRVNIMLQKVPFCRVDPLLHPRPTAERLNRFSYRSKIFHTEMANVNRKTVCTQTLNFSRTMRKLAFYICKNKGGDYLRSNCAADQRLCFRYIDSTIPLLSKCKAISCGCTARFLSDLVGNPGQFSRIAAKSLEREHYICVRKFAQDFSCTKIMYT